MLFAVLGERETESSVSFDFDQLPACHIPGSYKASISITGISLGILT